MLCIHGIKAELLLSNGISTAEVKQEIFFILINHYSYSAYLDYGEGPHPPSGNPAKDSLNYWADPAPKNKSPQEEKITTSSRRCHSSPAPIDYKITSRRWIKQEIDSREIGTTPSENEDQPHNITYGSVTSTILLLIIGGMRKKMQSL